ncbi:hypothetical protein OUZ56_020444 [Daphnia magna]|uniref:Uncharacterized protein n=1 Tax=Daphnia magna TaxID=35525 RepID=A0ABQ9ZEH4_9CRUS|nr:hypothetical protein OUZ56_020444 [Daphnia magna]
MSSGSKKTFSVIQTRGLSPSGLDSTSLQRAFCPSFNASSVMLCVCSGRFHHQPQHPHYSC